MTRSSFGAALLLLSAATAGTAPAAQSRAAQNQALASSATAILVDIVCTDLKRPASPRFDRAGLRSVRGRRQPESDSFTRVSRGSGIGVGVAWRSPGPSTLATTGPGAGEVSGDSGPGDEAMMRLSSITSPPSRYGWHRRRRSTTCRPPASRARRLACLRPVQGFGSCSATRGIGSCGAPSRKSRRPEHPVATTSCNARRSCWPAAVESRTRPRPRGPRRRGRAGAAAGTASGGDRST